MYLTEKGPCEIPVQVQHSTAFNHLKNSPEKIHAKREQKVIYQESKSLRWKITSEGSQIKPLTLG